MKKSIKLTESELSNLIKKIVKENTDNRPDELYSHINDLINYEYSDVDPRDTIDVLENIIKSVRSSYYREKTGSKYITKDDVKKNWNMNEEDQKVMLRKLAKKSVLGDEGGIYRGWTVEKLLNNAPKKVFYIYTHFEKIGFVDEVLDELKEKGYPVKKIDKPGVDKQQYKDRMQMGNEKFYSNLESKSIEDIEKLITAKNINKQKIDPIIRDILDRKKRESKDARSSNKNVDRKSVMQAKNHSRYNK